MLQKIAEGKYYLDYGPVQMTISACSNDRAFEQDILQTESYVHKLLEELTVCLDMAKRPLKGKQFDVISLPKILKSMVIAVKAAGDINLTPMAAVAGAFADAVADYLITLNATRVIVNNGGDIALRLAAEDSVVVGLQSDLNDRNCSHTFRIDGNSNCRGIATSGLGGRGFTKGIASAVTVLANSSSVADACATSLANQTTVDDPAVIKLPSEMMDPQSDIKGQLVTVGCPSLEPLSYYRALQGGTERARQLLQEGTILGAAIFTGPYMSVLPESLAAQVKAGHLRSNAVGKLESWTVG